MDWELGYDLKFEDYYGRNLLDFQKFNTIDSLVKTEIIHVLFSEEEISNIESFEMNKNDDDLLHSITLYNTGYNAYKAFIQISNEHVDISLLSNFFTPRERFYGDVMTKKVTYYDKNAKQWSDFRDCKTNISIDYQTKTIKLSGTHNQYFGKFLPLNIHF